MATNKKPVEEVTEVAAAKAPVDPWKEKVTIFIPRANNGEANYKIVGVNGRMFKVQRGINVDVPAPVAEVLQHSFEAQGEAIRFIDKVASN